jgi:two-component system response regulator FlrC
VVACGVEANAAAAVNAIRAGAKEYIPLPPDAELIAAVIAAVARDSSEFLFRDPAMERVVKLADQIAGSDASILITGESGTGKEVIAKYVHSRSKRANKPFISINCAAIPEALLESELFGHEKGAFTGAVARRIGKFEEASGGTLLLDEISEMDVRLQAKLLRAIQERLIDRVGGTKPVPVDIRIIATSNRNLNEAVREGSSARTCCSASTSSISSSRPCATAPATSPRSQSTSSPNTPRPTACPRAACRPRPATRLLRAPWPGNVRELENTLHRAVLLSSGDDHRPRRHRRCPTAPA